jgi:hypothetical protein
LHSRTSLDCSPPTHSPYRTGMSSLQCWAQLFLDGVLQTVCLSWPQTAILMIAT